VAVPLFALSVGYVVVVGLALRRASRAAQERPTRTAAAGVVLVGTWLAAVFLMCTPASLKGMSDDANIPTSDPCDYSAARQSFMTGPLPSDLDDCRDASRVRVSIGVGVMAAGGLAVGYLIRDRRRREPSEP
jgi:hypothetical protein